MKKKDCIKRLTDNIDGTATVEFAIVLPIMMLMVFTVLYIQEVSNVTFEAMKNSQYYMYKPGKDAVNNISVKFAYGETDQLVTKQFDDEFDGIWQYSQETVEYAIMTAAYEAEQFYVLNDAGELVPEVSERRVIPIGDDDLASIRASVYLQDELLRNWGSFSATAVSLQYYPGYIRRDYPEIAGNTFSSNASAIIRNPLFEREQGSSDYQPVLGIAKRMLPLVQVGDVMRSPMEFSYKYWKSR